MDFNRDKILKDLGQIKHPEKKKSIVELEMIKSITHENNVVEIVIEFAKHNDPFIKSLKKACERQALKSLPEGTQLNVEIMLPEVNKTEERKVLSGVKNIIAIASGKGGVGKSSVSTNLAVALAKEGYKVGLLDADIYGPSIPKMFGMEDAKPIAERRNGRDYIIPIEKYGVKLLSIGFFVRKEDPTIWRGPMATGTLKQLIEQGDWGELDYLLFDLPPGTGDVHLTLVQEVPITGAIIVSTPQDVALADVIKGINMFQGQSINVPILGLVENMAWFTPKELPDSRYFIFGEGGCKKLAEERSLTLLAQVPIIMGLREGGDRGKPAVITEDQTEKIFRELAQLTVQKIMQRNEFLPPTQKVRIDH